MKYSLITGLQKALIRTALPNVAGIIIFLITNPALLQQILGKWSDMTVLELALFITNLIVNWWKNKDLGKEKNS